MNETGRSRPPVVVIVYQSKNKDQLEIPEHSLAF